MLRQTASGSKQPTPVFLGGINPASRAARLDPGDVGGEEVDAVPIEVASGAVVVLGRSRICMSREDLGITERDARVEGVSDCRMTQ
jgi:hypothetical protein